MCPVLYVASSQPLIHTKIDQDNMAKYKNDIRENPFSCWNEVGVLEEVCL